MSITTFLTNETLWRSLTDRIKLARHVEAAVAYFGQEGSRLLPLNSGHRLVVDMSITTVRAGGTDPREIEKLIRRGVKVFTRRNLHAKIVVADKCVIVGSANVSKRSRDLLDEAGILADDRGVVRRAHEFIEKLCTEPVRPEYLRECKRVYRPPHLARRGPASKRRQHRVQHAKLWLVSLRESVAIPDSEVGRYGKGERKAKELLKAAQRSKTSSFHWPYKPKMADELEAGDWIIQVLKRRDNSIVVYPPGQLLLVDSYIRDRKKKRGRWVFHVEMPIRSQTLVWRRFQRAAVRFLKNIALAKPHTMPIRDVQAADSFLSMWTAGGRVARG